MTLLQDTQLRCFCSDLIICQLSLVVCLRNSNRICSTLRRQDWAEQKTAAGDTVTYDITSHTSVDRNMKWIKYTFI